MNRITDAIATQEQNIKDRLADGRTTRAKLDELHTTLDMEFFEYVRCQEIKSLAVSAQTITLEEGQMVYAYMGESPETFNEQSLAVKITITELCRELMQRQVQK